MIAMKIILSPHHSSAVWSKLLFVSFIALLLIIFNPISSTKKETLAELSRTPTRTSPPEVSAFDPSLSRVQGQLFKNDSAFTGTLTKRTIDGYLIQSEEYVRGQRHGTFQKWFANGQLKEEREYSFNQKTGTHRGWHKNGKTRFQSYFKKGLSEGVSKTWYSTGQLGELRSYRAGRESGPQKAWSPNGVLITNYYVKEGRRYGTLGLKPCFTIRNDEKLDRRDR